MKDTAIVNATSLNLKAFKRGKSHELSKWYMGCLTTNLAESNDTNGAFFLVEVTMAPGNEPPPHVHSYEDELFYVLEGEFDVYVGQEAFKVRAGECVFLPRFVPRTSRCQRATSSTRLIVYGLGAGNGGAPGRGMYESA